MCFPPRALCLCFPNLASSRYLNNQPGHLQHLRSPSVFLTQATSICSRIDCVVISLIVDVGNLFLFFFSDQSDKCIDFIDLLKEPGFDSVAFKKVLFVFVFFTNLFPP